MGDNKDYKDLVILAIAAIGISIAWFAYLVYIRDRQVREKTQSLSQNLNQLSPNIPLNTKTEIPVRNQPVYDERLYQLLDNQQYQLEHINSNINNLRSLNYTPYKMPNQRDVANMANMNKLSTPRAGSVTSIRTTTEDKTRQQEFGMI